MCGSIQRFFKKVNIFIISILKLVIWITIGELLLLKLQGLKY